MITKILFTVFWDHNTTETKFKFNAFWYTVWPFQIHDILLTPKHHRLKDRPSFPCGQINKRIKIARRNKNNLRYADNNTLMAESEEELKSLLMKVKEESEELA